ncbi:MAG: hypothetical protein OXU69_01595 [Gemmatimonadota bacterium]|nr:hypothetical protein [Gemmatimonadota bacterium]MDE2983370.1 hypothetical protein [Gemmatimonadota bacterium]
MKRWIHLLWGVVIAATGAQDNPPESVRHDQRPVPEGWKSHDDRRRFARCLPGSDEGPSKRSYAREVADRNLLLESGAVARNDELLERLRRAGLI